MATEGYSRTHLPESLAEVQQRREQVKAAWVQARAADERVADKGSIRKRTRLKCPRPIRNLG